MKVKLRKDQSLLIWASAASLALWFVPYLRIVTLPLDYYNTHIHELCHALVSTLTGGKSHIIVYIAGNGVTPTEGGNMLLVATAGYIGSAVVGGILIFGSRTVKSATTILWVAAGFLALSMVVFVRGDAVGVASGIAWTGVLGSAAYWMRGESKIFAVQFLGIQQCLNASLSLWTLMKVSAFEPSHSDARIMERLTNVPAMFWAVLWMVIGLAVIVLGFSAAWRSKPRSQKAKRDSQT